MNVSLRHPWKTKFRGNLTPLQFASILGFIFATFGLLIMAYVLGRYLLDGSTVPGFPFLASIIAIFSGVQLFTLGIFGEYLARMHFRTMERPPYTVCRKVTASIGHSPECVSNEHD